MFFCGKSQTKKPPWFLQYWASRAPGKNSGPIWVPVAGTLATREVCQVAPNIASKLRDGDLSRRSRIASGTQWTR